jgi:hypothetical protein
MGRECSINGSEKKCIKMLVGMPKAKRSLGVLKRRCEDNIKVDFREKE